MSNDTSSAGRGPQRESGKEKFWRRTLSDLAASGQSIRAFCREQQLSEPSLYAWRRTLARRDAARRAADTPAAAAAAFLPIRLTRTPGVPAARARIEIVLSGGHRIRLRPPVDRSALIEIVAALQSAHAEEA